MAAPGKLNIKVEQGDITELQVDAVVNAANESLQGGGGVDWAIHEAAGPELFKYFVGHKPISPGQAVLSPGFNLPAKYIIHAVGPVYYGSGAAENEQLKQAYVNSLKLAESKQVTSIAFSLISAGAYGYPTKLAAQLAREGVEQYFANNPSSAITQVIVVGFTEPEYRVVKQVFKT